MGLLLSFISPFTILHPDQFAITYSFGNILAMGSTAFLMGPWRQIKNMFDPSRLIATLIYLGLLVATLVVAFTIANIPLLLVLIVL